MSSVIFIDYEYPRCILTKEQVVDLIETMSRHDSIFVVNGKMTKRENSYCMGMHVYDEMLDSHQIFINPELVKKSFESSLKTGGNVIAPQLRVAMGMVIAHEVQHANQHRLHSMTDKSFFGKKRSRYESRPCEREARQFADESIDLISSVLGIATNANARAETCSSFELTDIARNLSCSESVNTCDIISELKLSGINNATNVEKVRELMAEMLARKKGMLSHV